MPDAETLVFAAATGSDVDAVVALVESAYRGESSRTGWTTEADLLDGRRTDAAAIGAVVDDPRSILLLARRPGRSAGGPGRPGPIAACCHLRDDGGRAYFGMFAVRPDAQGGGIGRAVMAESERRATGWGARELWMTVIAQRTELIAWYERLGFSRTGETQPFPYGDERFGVPRRDDLAFVVLAKTLT
jgi:ribosomal protein S18 acetylase RimI-like enzyme